MSKRDNRFARIGETYEKFKDRKEQDHRLSYERKIVKKILTSLGVQPFELRVREPEHMDDQVHYLTFAWLYENYPNMPVQLMGQDSWDPPDLWLLLRPSVKRDSYLQKWKEIRKLLDGCGREGVGCVFRASTLVGGDVVFHNADLPYVGFKDDDANVFGKVSRMTDTGEMVHLELLNSFIKRLSFVWEPT